VLIAQRLLNYHGAASQNKLLKTAQNAQHNSTLLHSQSVMPGYFAKISKQIWKTSPK